jgi:molecular chaperone GrpE
MSSNPPTRKTPATGRPPRDQAEPEAPPSDDPALAPTSEVPVVQEPPLSASDDVPEAPADSSATIADADPPDPLAEARADAARFKDQWIRTAADFDNFRKRTRRDIEDARRAGREELLKELLPVFDNLERAIQSSQRATEVKAVADGLNMIVKQFSDTLARVGINKVPTTGTAFDPAVHEAIQQVETADHPPGTIVAEVQPGYVQGDRLVRAAMVVVAKPKAEEQSN